MKRLINVGVALWLLLPMTPAQCQWNLSRQQPGVNQLSLTFGVDPAVITSLGYGRTTTVFGAATLLTADIGLVSGDEDVRDYRARAGAQVELLHRGLVRVAGRAAFVTRGTDNRIFRAVNMGAALSGTAGVYGRRWFAAAEVGFDKAIVTHLRHSEEYRVLYYRDAKDGWYLDNGGTWGFGGMVGRSIGRTELVVRLGLARTEAGETPNIPGYAVVGWGVAF